MLHALLQVTAEPKGRVIESVYPMYRQDGRQNMDKHVYTSIQTNRIQS
jgi:hypothetical protein